MQADRVRFLQREIARLELDTAEIRDLPSHIAEYLGRQNVIEALQAGRLQPVWLLDELPRLRPQGVYLIKVRLEQSRVEVAGFASSRNAVDEFVGNIAASSRLASPQLAGTSPDNGPLAAFPVGFSITAQMRPGPEERKR